jgi:hypothetical protein
MDELVLKQIADMLSEAERKNKEFKRDTYEESFHNYLDENASVWSQLNGIGELPQEEQDTERSAVADCLVHRAEEMLKSAKSRSKRDTLQLNLNLYMVSYFLPALVAYQRRSGGREDDMKKLTGTICDTWSRSFKNQIQTADFESIQAGFKQKLCFVTTAVCQGLQKPQDCRELVMMKQYRDTYLLNQPDGEALIREYYDIAPTIVKRIEKEASPEEKYLYLWNQYIKPCVSLLDDNRQEQCREVYEAMMNELKDQYMVTNRHEKEQTPQISK